MSNLVIVESPAKAKTIQRYLGPGYDVMASMGHIRDLPKSKLGVDIEHGFAPQYVEIKDKAALIKTLRNHAAKADTVYLATDPDREGEAISWHLAQMLALNLDDSNRVTFNEITKTGVSAGMAHPRKIDLDLVDAQQARRVLDRILGYQLSPFLWKKIKSGLSAGRVQSVALRLICDRENEIRAFTPVEYWTIEAELSGEGSDKSFVAHLFGKIGAKKLEIHDEAEARQITETLAGAAYAVRSLKKGTRSRQPAPPFITSTLQQEGSRKLGYTGQRTMKIAQQLYEGVDVAGLGTTGLITYMRTDSLRISDEARTAGNAYIEKRWGKSYLPEKPRYYKSRQNAQDAHEAIRPSMPELAPDDIKNSLTPEQYRLYRLIWSRFIASLMAACVQDTVSAEIAAGDYLFKASGYSVRFDGFTTLYVEGRDDDGEDETALPPLAENDTLHCDDLSGNQHFTEPPPRFTEATLIKSLEENGIGRPSTYAPIISTLLYRNYVEKDKKAILPTPLGEVITTLLKEHFKEIVDVDFTANMEKELDAVEEGRQKWVNTLDTFYQGFTDALHNAETALEGTRIKVPDVESDVICENCGRKMVIKTGRFGKFLACPGYPECKNTKPIVLEMPGECPLCGGKILQKKSKNNKKFFGCATYPACAFMTWDEPTAEHCPECGKTLFKKRGGVLACLNEECHYSVQKESKPRTGKKGTAAAAAKTKAVGTKTAGTAKKTAASKAKSTAKPSGAKSAKAPAKKSSAKAESSE